MTAIEWSVAAVDGVDMGSHELSLQPVLEGLLPEGGVLVDIGAHMGLWTIRLGERASHVYAVEPNPAVVSVLRDNIALNGLSRKVTVLDVAAWDEDGTCRLYPPDGHDDDPRSGWMTTRPGDGDVPARRLDGVISPARIDLVKVDTEGADIRALRGMTRLLSKHRPVLFVEGHHVLPWGYAEDELTGAVGDLGYRWEWGAEFNTVPYLICRPA